VFHKFAGYLEKERERERQREREREKGGESTMCPKSHGGVSNIICINQNKVHILSMN
jgi:hypothetical protein